MPQTNLTLPLSPRPHRSLDVAVETKTKDNVFVNIIVSTQYMVLRDPERMYDAFYKLTDSREQIRSYIFDVVRSTVPRINLVRPRNLHP